MKKRRRRFPRWARVAVLIGLILFGYQQYGYWSTPSSARAAGAGLRASSAYADPSERDVIDLARARQVIGDRPLLVAVLPADYPKRKFAACEDVAKQHPKNLTLAYVGARPPAFCAGSRFPSPTTPGLSTDDWVFQVLLQTQYASSYRVPDDAHDRTAEVEEFVLAFDAQVRSDYANGIPNRQADPDPVVWWRVMLELAGLVVLSVGAFAGIRIAAAAIIRARNERAALRTRRLDREQELSRAAAEIEVYDPEEPPEKARLRAHAAEQYLHALTAFEAARNRANLDAAQPAFSALGQTLQQLEPGRRRHGGKRVHR